ncbi:MAG: homocysteine S-methyltransferase family protein, partial [Nitrospinota bacterium]
MRGICVHLKINMEKLFINKVVILDGRPNAVISRKNLKPEDYGGRSKAGCSEILNITRPHLIGSLHLDYLEAGADIIRTNSFGGNEHFLSQFALTHKAQEINRAACRVAKEAARRFSSKGSPRFVAGNIGCDICPHFVPGRFPFSKLVATFFNHALPLLEEGADLLFLEECRHTLTTKAAICGIHEAFAILGKTVPLIVSATVENGGTMAGGQSVEAFYASISHANFLLFGLHSKEGPEALAEPLRKITEISTSRIGMWADLAPVLKKEPQKISTSRFASEMKRVAGTQCPAALGGGEGVTPEHIKKVFELFHEKKPAQAKRARLRLLAGKKLLNIDLETKPIVVGERANISGSRQFRTLVYEEKFGEA